MSSPPLDRAAEARRLLELYRDRGQDALVELLERQFTVLHNRAQVLLGLSGVVITTTGFSGRLVCSPSLRSVEQQAGLSTRSRKRSLIAGTSRLAQGLIIAGVATTLYPGAHALGAGR